MLKKIINSNKYLVIISLLMVVFCSPIIIKYSPYNLEVKKINLLVEEITQCNLSLNQSIHNQSIDSDLAKDLLTTGIINLDNINKELSSLPVIKRNELLKTKVIETISYNTSLYQITLTLLKPSDFNSLNAKFSEYSNSIKLVENSYNTLNLLGLDASFPKESKVFFENSSNFVTTVLKITREKDVKTGQNKFFSQGLNDCLVLLDNIDEDLKPALYKIKEDGRSTDVLLTDIKDKRNKLSSIKTKSYTLSIPEESSGLYQNLQETLNTYELYINALQYSIITETSSSPEDIISENYKESFSKYQTFLNNFEELKKELDIFNKNCI